MKKNSKFYFIIVLFTLLLIELLMRVFGVATTYSERTYGKFFTYYGFTSDNEYHSGKPNSIIENKQKEFNYSFPANSDGFREEEFPKSSIDSLSIIYILGDSYVEGDGVDYYHSMPQEFQNRLLSSGYRHSKVFNVGANGSDPVFQYKFFKDKLAETKPKLVLMLLNFSDVDDISIRGGFERFTEQGGVTFKKAPFGFTLYKYSRIMRLFFRSFGYNEGMIPKNNKILPENEFNTILQSLRGMDSITSLHNIDFVSIVHFTPHEANFNAFSGSLENFILENDSNLKFLNISQALYESFEGFEVNDYSWPINGHFNELGYKILSNTIFDALTENYPEILENLQNFDLQ